MNSNLKSRPTDSKRNLDSEHNKSYKGPTNRKYSFILKELGHFYFIKSKPWKFDFKNECDISYCDISYY